VWLAFKFVAPGDFSGLSFDGLAWVNQRLVWFPQPWRLVPMGAGAPEPEAPPTAPTAAPPTSPPTAPRTVGAMAAADAHLSPSDFVRRMRRADLWPPDIVGSEVVLRLSGGSNADLLFSWAVFAPRRGPQAIIREVTTERGVVQRILRGARETRETLLGSGLVRVRDVTVAVGEVASLLDEARGMHIPIVGVTPTIGFDGTTYTMSSDFGLSASELVWWSGGPPEWQALTRWAAATRKRLHGWVAPGTPLDD